jgi:hypothetical protein
MGYPPDSIAHRFPLSPAEQIAKSDFAIVNPQNHELLAVFDLEQEALPVSPEATTARYSLPFTLASRKDVPFYIVTDGENGFDFHVVRAISDARLSTPAAVALPAFESLVAGKTGRTRIQHREHHDRSLKSLRRMTWVLGLAALTLLVGDVLIELSGKRLLTPERLSLLAAIAILMPLPFVQTFRWLGVEWELNLGRSPRKLVPPKSGDQSVESSDPGNRPTRASGEPT